MTNNWIFLFVQWMRLITFVNPNLLQQVYNLCLFVGMYGFLTSERRVEQEEEEEEEEELEKFMKQSVS